MPSPNTAYGLAVVVGTGETEMIVIGGGIGDDICRGVGVWDGKGEEVAIAIGVGNNVDNTIGTGDGKGV